MDSQGLATVPFRPGRKADSILSPATQLDRPPLYVEVSPLLTPHLAGIGRFAARLVVSLARLTPLRLINTIQGEHARNMRLSRALPCGREITVTEADVGGGDADIEVWARRVTRLPSQRHDPALARRSPILYTMLRPHERHFRRELCLLHDFTAVLLPWTHVQETCDKFGGLFTEAAALCDKFLANSQSTQADASWLLACPVENVVLGYPGPSQCVRAHAHPEQLPRSRHIILVVATLEPRKNGRFLLDWFLHTDVLGADLELWWVGPAGWLCNLKQLAGARRRKVRFLGPVSDHRLCALYQQAAFTIYPSLYEGFGFPVLDSLRHGAPVVCSLNSSLQEFAGPGVFYFDPCDRASLNEACRALLAAQPLRVERPDLEERFCWDALARTVVGLAYN